VGHWRTPLARLLLDPTALVRQQHRCVAGK
jgi:hypothetical protein